MILTTIELYWLKKSKDILFNSIEIGSFGTREVFGQDFSFGTGLAMPRYTQALLKVEKVCGQV